MVPLAERTVVHVLRQGAQENPSRIAVRDAHEQLDYRELLELSGRSGAAFGQLGIGRDDAVMLMLNNNIDHVLSWFGLSCVGAVEVPLNTASMAPQIAFIANDCAARVLVIEQEYLPRLAAVADTLVHLRHVVVRGDTAAAEQLPFEVHSVSVLQELAHQEPVELRPQDTCGIMYTSGTTGEPKGVMVTHAQTYGRNGPLGPASPRRGDVTLVTLPIYHVIGQCRGLYNTLIAGGTTILEDRFSASRFWDICREHNVTYACLVGAMAGYLLAQPERPDDADNPVQRIALGTTIPQVERFRERFGVPELHVSYGLTEAGGVLVGSAEADGCGYLRDDFLARLVDENDIEVADGEVGELVLRPTEPWTTMTGYLNRPEETTRRWRNLWLHTGDLMKRSEDGKYIFVGRLSDRIRHKGENISPAAVEEQLVLHPAVGECAVVGVDTTDPSAAPGDQEVLAAIVPMPGMDVDCAELVEFLSHRLPHFAMPRFFRALERLPRTDSTHRVQRGLIASDGTDGTWDRVAAGLVMRRDGSLSPRVNGLRTIP